MRVFLASFDFNMSSIVEIEKKVEAQLLITFQDLFSKQQLKKNVYICQNLSPDMNLKTKVVLQERRVAAITKDPSTVLSALQKCPNVQVLDKDLLRINVPGDNVLVVTKGVGEKKLPNGELKKMIGTIAKDLRYQTKETKGKVQLQFQTEYAASQFIDRVKAKQLPIACQLKSKDAFECLKQSIKTLRKERKNQQKQTTYVQKNYNYGYPPVQQQNPYMGQYQPFVRRAIPSDDQEQQLKPVGKKIEQKQPQGRKRLDSADFPEL